MQNDKLLPCPMCGGEMELVNVEHSPLLLRNCVFKCKKGCIESVHSFNTEEEAIKACNTRKPIERIVEQLECMQKYNSEQAEIYHNVEKPNAYTREMKDLYIDRANCYGVAIRTVKGGVDNETN